MIYLKRDVFKKAALKPKLYTTTRTNRTEKFSGIHEHIRQQNKIHNVI